MPTGHRPLGRRFPMVHCFLSSPSYQPSDPGFVPTAPALVNPSIHRSARGFAGHECCL